MRECRQCALSQRSREEGESNTIFWTLSAGYLSEFDSQIPYTYLQYDAVRYLNHVAGSLFYSWFIISVRCKYAEDGIDKVEQNDFEAMGFFGKGRFIHLLNSLLQSNLRSLEMDQSL